MINNHYPILLLPCNLSVKMNWMWVHHYHAMAPHGNWLLWLVRVCRQAPDMPPCSSSLVRCSRQFPPLPSACRPAAMVARRPATATLPPPPRAAWSRALGLAMDLPPLLPPHPHPLLPPPAATSTCSPTQVSQVQKSLSRNTFRVMDWTQKHLIIIHLKEGNDSSSAFQEFMMRYKQSGKIVG